MATRLAWLSILFFCTLGIVVALLLPSGSSILGRLVNGIVFGIFLTFSNAVHSFGHILAGKMVGTTMDVLLLTSTRDVTLYLKDQSGISRWAIIGRSFGGPASNLVLGLFCVWLNFAIGSEWLRMFAYFNLAITVWTLCPVPTIDGWVIWGELFGFRRRQPVK